MKHITRLVELGEVLLVDIRSLTRSQIRDLVHDLPVRRLRIWLDLYMQHEAYEVCGILKEIIDTKSAT